MGIAAAKTLYAKAIKNKSWHADLSFKSPIWLYFEILIAVKEARTELNLGIPSGVARYWIFIFAIEQIILFCAMFLDSKKTSVKWDFLFASGNFWQPSLDNWV